MWCSALLLQVLYIEAKSCWWVSQSLPQLVTTSPLFTGKEWHLWWWCFKSFKSSYFACNFLRPRLVISFENILLNTRLYLAKLQDFTVQKPLSGSLFSLLICECLVCIHTQLNHHGFSTESSADQLVPKHKALVRSFWVRMNSCILRWILTILYRLHTSFYYWARLRVEIDRSFLTIQFQCTLIISATEILECVVTWFIEPASSCCSCVCCCWRIL